MQETGSSSRSRKEVLLLRTSPAFPFTGVPSSRLESSGSHASLGQGANAQSASCVVKTKRYKLADGSSADLPWVRGLCVWVNPLEINFNTVAGSMKHPAIHMVPGTWIGHRTYMIPSARLHRMT
mmetsp:Transcript_47676/g.85829  ORF Transcript_47676/g.85829 Transcript_47676/m.85829 type:complete len:124 (+) Transcript_47676:132-503(+)